VILVCGLAAALDKPGFACGEIRAGRLRREYFRPDEEGTRDPGPLWSASRSGAGPAAARMRFRKAPNRI